MDIRSAQKIAWENMRAEGFDTTDVSSQFCLLSSEVAQALDASYRGHPQVSEELADIAMFLLGLAEMVGTDLQEAIEAKRILTGKGAHRQLTSGVITQDAIAAKAAAMSRGKLVRDKIPQIIRDKGLEPVVYTASTEEYGRRLRDKLREEVEEFLASDDDPEELADILEVLYALAGHAGTDRQQLEQLRATEARNRGGFADRIIWSGNETEAPPQQVRASATAS